MIAITELEEGSFGFRLKNEHDRVLLTSVAVKTTEKVQELIDNLNQEDGNRLRYERKTNHKGDFLFNVKNTAGQLIGKSELYSSEAGMENGIRNLKIVLSSLKA